MCNMFGGPSSAETGTLQQQQGLSQALHSAFTQQYAQQQDVLGRLQAQIMRIQTGQTGPGFSGAENAARIALIQNTNAAAARNAIQGSRERGVGTQVGQNTSGLTRQAGINAQIAGGIEAMTGANEANQLLAEQAENFQQGRSNAISTASALQSLQGDYSPSTYSSQLGSSLGAQFNMADKINTENIQRSQAIAGLVEKGVMSAATFGLGGAAAVGAGESFGEGASDFFKGGINALTGSNYEINPGGR